MTTALEARLSEVLEGVSCPFNFGNDNSNESAITPKGSHDPIADSLPSVELFNLFSLIWTTRKMKLPDVLKDLPQHKLEDKVFSQS